jgi:phage/plasmid-associated DNA primase
MGWFGYTITGETVQQKCMFIVGHSASNGKSTILKMCDIAFDIYTFKLDTDVFNHNYSMRHKQYAKLKKPVRIGYVEEMKRDKLDIDVLKNFVDGHKNNTNVMYGEADNLEIHCKLTSVSNNEPSFTVDEGWTRRGLIEYFKNRFVSEADYKELTDKTNHYVIDTSLNGYMQTQEFGNAFFQLLLPYSIQYYQKGLIMTKTVKQGFKDICDENDKMKSFIEEKFIRTEDSNDKIHKPPRRIDMV